MPRIPAKIPKSANDLTSGCIYLNTDTNNLEYVSDGIITPVSSSSSSKIQIGEKLDYSVFDPLGKTKIRVGTNRDFTTLEEAFRYIIEQNSFNMYYLSTSPAYEFAREGYIIELASDYVFEKGVYLVGISLPTVDVTQEDYNVPLLVRSNVALKLTRGSLLGSVKLNLKGDTSITGSPRYGGIDVSFNSTLYNLNLKASDFKYAVHITYSSSINSLNIDKAEKLERSACLLMYNCFALVLSANIADVGKTYPMSYGNGFWVNQSDLRIYYGQNVFIDNVVQGIRIMEGGRVTVSEGSPTISNSNYGIYFAFNGGTLNTIQGGVNFINNKTNVYPSITTNTFNRDGIWLD